MEGGREQRGRGAPAPQQGRCCGPVSSV